MLLVHYFWCDQIDDTSIRGCLGTRICRIPGIRGKKLEGRNRGILYDMQSASAQQDGQSPYPASMQVYIIRRICPSFFHFFWPMYIISSMLATVLRWCWCVLLDSCNNMGMNLHNAMIESTFLFISTFGLQVLNMFLPYVFCANNNKKFMRSQSLYKVSNMLVVMFMSSWS